MFKIPATFNKGLKDVVNKLGCNDALHCKLTNIRHLTEGEISVSMTPDKLALTDINLSFGVGLYDLDNVQKELAFDSEGVQRREVVIARNGKDYFLMTKTAYKDMVKSNKEKKAAAGNPNASTPTGPLERF